MSQRTLSCLLLLAALCSIASIGQASSTPTFDPAIALVYVALPTHDALIRYENTGLPAYARLYGSEGGYLLTGVDTVGLKRLANAGLSVRVLDVDAAGATYYLAYPSPGLPHPYWRAHGPPLLDDGVQALLHLSPRQADRLSETGLQLHPLRLTPKPLRPALAPEVIPAVTTPDPVVQSMISQVISTTVHQYTGDLSGEWPVEIGGEPYTIISRYTYSGLPIWKATRLVDEHMTALGLDVERHVWGSVSAPNIIGQIRGTFNPDDIFIIGAHLDDAPFGYVAPGADDNASGSTAVLIAADIFSQYDWNCTLRFVLWTGEEQWTIEEPYGHGSYPYAQRSHDLGENIVGVLNLDMIGYNTTGSDPDIDLEATTTLSPSVQLAQLFADVVHTYNLDLVPHVRPKSEGLGDHSSFWSYGYTAIMGIEYVAGDFNPYYHTVQDKLKHLDITYFTEFVRAAVGTFAHMSDCLLTDINRVYLPIVLSE